MSHIKHELQISKVTAFHSTNYVFVTKFVDIVGNHNNVLLRVKHIEFASFEKIIVFMDLV